jgi:hypothetical protein
LVDQVRTLKVSFLPRLRIHSTGHFQSLAHQENRLVNDRFLKYSGLSPETGRRDQVSEAVVHRLVMPSPLKNSV